MKRTWLLSTAIVVAAGFSPPPSTGQAKLAQTGFNFLSVGTDARATAMGGAFTTIGGSSTSLFYNAAGLAGMSSFVDFSLSQMDWIADITYVSGAAAFAPFAGRFGVLGISFVSVDYGEFHFTQVAANEQGYRDLEGLPAPTSYVIGIGYGKAISSQFSLGGQIKYAHQDLGRSIVPVTTTVIDSAGRPQQQTTFNLKDYPLGTLAFDFGTLYRTGLESLAFGVSIRNFAPEIRYDRESLQLPLTFAFGISMNMLDFLPDLGEDHSFYVSVDAVHPRSYQEYLSMGGEYVFHRAISLRMGYITQHPDYDLTAGIGLQKAGIGVDYSFMPHRIFNSIHRLSVRFSM